MFRPVMPALALLAALVLPACSPSGPKGGAVPFHMTYDTGMAAAESTGKPPMFFFTADW